MTEESRRDLFKRAAQGAAAFVALKAGTKVAAFTEVVSGRKLPELTQHESQEIVDIPGTELQFNSNTHVLDSIQHNFDAYVNAIRESDYVWLEGAEILNSEDRQLIRMNSEDFKAEVMRRDESSFHWARCMTVLAFRLGKPILVTDPTQTVNDFVLGIKFEPLQDKLLLLKLAQQLSLVGTIAMGTATSLSNDDPTMQKKAALATGGYALAHETLDAVTESVFHKVFEILHVPKSWHGTSLGKVVAEISFNNYRDFSSLAGLYAINGENALDLKNKKIAGFYGGLHFPIMQIAKLGEDVVRRKLELYKALVKDSLPGRARIFEYDANLGDVRTRDVDY